MAEAFDLAAGSAPVRSGSSSSTSSSSIVIAKDQQAYVWSRIQIEPNESTANTEVDDDEDNVDNINNTNNVVVAAESTGRGGGGEGRGGGRNDRPPRGPPLVPPPRSGAASVVVPSMHRMYCFGGYGGGTGRLDDFWMFDFKENKWEEVEVLSDEKPGCRENNGVVISDSNRSFLLFGGYNGAIWLNDLWKFDCDTHRWTCLQQNSHEVDGGGGGGANDPSDVSQRPCARFGYVSVVYDGKFVLWGGFDGGRWLADMFEYSMTTSSWTRIQQVGSIPSVRSCPAWCERSGMMYLHGGYDGLERKDDFYCCDLRTYTWHRMADMGTRPSARYFHSSVVYSNKLFIYGGYSGSQRLCDLWAFDFETNHWSEVDARGQPPSGRSSLVAQVYENYLYVFAGYNGNSVMNDMYKCRLKQIDVPPSSLVDDFQRLINDDEMADVKFVVNGEIFHAHRCILAVRSQYFRAMLFNGHMRESTTTSPDEGIVLSDVSPQVFMKILEYLYTDTVRDLPWSLGIEVMMAAELFMLDRLKGICEDVIRNEITVDNVVGVLMASHRHNATGLKQISLEVIVQNMSHPKIQAGLQTLESEGKLLIEIIKLQSQQSSSSASSSTSRRTGHGNSPTGRRSAVHTAAIGQQPMDAFYHGRHGDRSNPVLFA